MTAAAKLAAGFQAIAADMKAIYSVLAGKAAVSDLDPQLFYKVDPYSPAFAKTSANTLSIKAGTGVMVAGVKVEWEFDTAIILPTLTPGTDYAIYACTDGSIRADADWWAPTGYDSANSRKVGGFHYGLVAPGTTPADGGFNTATSAPLISMVWTQTDVDHLAGINVFSLWDVKYRPTCLDPRGMVCVAGSFWVDIYFCSTDHLTNGTSKYLTDVANGGTVLPKIPLTFGGDGTNTYTTFSWFEAVEIARSHGKRLLSYPEFAAVAFGVTENQSLGGNSAILPATTREAGYTSKWGVEQATGHLWVWGDSVHGVAGSASTASPDVYAGVGRGQTYGTPYAALFGGARDYEEYSGSRASRWAHTPWSSIWNVGMRAACGHLQTT